MRESFQQRLKKAMKEKGYKQVDVIEKSKKYSDGTTKITKTDLSQYVNGKNEAGQDKLYLLAKVLGVTEAWLMGYDVPRKDFEIRDEVETYQVPIVSHISAGLPIYSEQDIVDYGYVPSFLKKKEKNLFYLRVKGDSMNKEFKENDLVLVDTNASVENGQIGVVQINGYDATVKRVKYQDNKIILLPESTNEDHLPQIYTNDHCVKIIGRVISVQKFY